METNDVIAGGSAVIAGLSAVVAVLQSRSARRQADIAREHLTLAEAEREDRFRLDQRAAVIAVLRAGLPWAGAVERGAEMLGAPDGIERYLEAVQKVFVTLDREFGDALVTARLAVDETKLRGLINELHHIQTSVTQSFEPLFENRLAGRTASIDVIHEVKRPGREAGDALRRLEQCAIDAYRRRAGLETDRPRLNGTEYVRSHHSPQRLPVRVVVCSSSAARSWSAAEKPVFDGRGTDELLLHHMPSESVVPKGVSVRRDLTKTRRFSIASRHLRT